MTHMLFLRSGKGCPNSLASIISQFPYLLLLLLEDLALSNPNSLSFFPKISRTFSAGGNLPNIISEVRSFNGFSIQPTCVNSLCLLYSLSVHLVTLSKKYWDWWLDWLNALSQNTREAVTSFFRQEEREATLEFIRSALSPYFLSIN